MRDDLMRGGRIATALTLALGGTLGGCATMPDFLADTFTYNVNPNAPIGSSINMQRVRGIDTSVEPLRAEPGDVWPSEITRTPTLQELEKESAGASPAAPPADLTPFMPGHTQPRPAPGSNGFGAPPAATSGVPATGGGRDAATARVPQPGQRQPTVLTPQGNAPVTTDGAGYKTLATPQGNAILVPNGNGTSTLIKPDGTIETVPTGK